MNAPNNAPLKVALATFAFLMSSLLSATAAWAGGGGPNVSDLIFNFPGTAAEFFMIQNNAGDFVQLHPTNGPDNLTVGDLDGTGPDDIAVAYAPGGLFRFNTVTGYVQLADASLVPDQMVAGNFDGTGNDDLAMTFSSGPAGTFILNDSGFTQISNFTAVDMVASNVDGTGPDELAVTFNESTAVIIGTWIIFNQGATFQKISNEVADRLYGCGDINGDGQTRGDLLLNYGSPLNAAFAYLDGTTFQQLTPSGQPASNFGCADLDGATGDELIIAVAAGTFYRNLIGTNFVHIANEVATGMTAGDINAMAGEDLLITFAGVTGTFTYIDNTLPFVQRAAFTAQGGAIAEITDD